MKSIEWHNFLEAQREEHGKRIFTITELAHASGASRAVLNVELGRLIKRGIVRRYARGKYGSPKEPRVEELAAFLDPSAYVTSLFALHRHNLVTQTPREITCFTNRRHNRSRERSTPLGRFVFVRTGPRVYAHPGPGRIAEPEQAFCDFIGLARRKSLDVSSLVTFRGLDSLSQSKLKRILRRYPRTVAEQVWRLLPSTPRGNPRARPRQMTGDPE